MNDHRARAKTPVLPALLALAGAILLALYGTQARAQAAPDAGGVLRDLQQTPAQPAPRAPQLQRIEEAPAPAADNQAKVRVKSVTITGNQEIPVAELQPLVATLPGTERTLAQLEAAARRITAYYRNKGYAVARAYLPAQDVTDGMITINVIEGRISSHRINNQSRLPDERAGAYFDQVKDGAVIKSDQIDRGLLLLQDTPGVGGARATLQPGASVGTSELLIDLAPAKAYGGSVVLDNYGSRYTGQYRLGGNLALASPLKLGDQLSVNALTTLDGGPGSLTFGRLAYQLPIGSSGLRVGAAYFETRYKLGKEFQSLQAHGTATSASVFAAYPFIRSRYVNLSGVVSYEEKRLKDYVDATSTYTPKRVDVATVGLSGSVQDALLGGGITSADLSVAQGHLSIDSASALAIDASSAQSNGGYTRLTYGASRLQRFTDRTFLSASVTAQQASKNLDSSEKFSLGGANGVRAYPQGEGIGDEGWRATAELRHNLASAWQAVLFYDWGHVTFNRHPFGTAVTNQRSLAGAGFGVNANFSSVQMRAYLAWRTQGGAPVSVPAGAAKQPTAWVQAVLLF